MGAKVSISSYLFSKRDCATNVFWGRNFCPYCLNVERKSSSYKLMQNFEERCFIQNENKCTNRQKETILSKLHQSRCSLTATAKFLMSTKVFLNSSEFLSCFTEQHNFRQIVFNVFCKSTYILCHPRRPRAG